jgi:hypothetical protein
MATKYCVRCDQLGNAEEMEPLYGDPGDDKPTWWVHVRCRTEHGRKVFAAQVAAFGAVMAEMAMDEASKSVVDLERTQGLSILAISLSEAAGNPQRLEAIRGELVRQGFDPDKPNS